MVMVMVMVMVMAADSSRRPQGGGGQQAAQSGGGGQQAAQSGGGGQQAAQGGGGQQAAQSGGGGQQAAQSGGQPQQGDVQAQSQSSTGSQVAGAADGFTPVPLIGGAQKQAPTTDADIDKIINKIDPSILKDPSQAGTGALKGPAVRQDV